ncbi:hypothetical protein N9L68_01070 [bacterium]|nr:hypothetical protein [bacterium]
MQFGRAQGDRLLADQHAIATDQHSLEQGRAVAASVTQKLGHMFLAPSHAPMQQIAGVQTSMQSAAAAQPPVQHVHRQPATQHLHTDHRQVALADARQALRHAIGGRQVNLADASQDVQVDARQVTQQAIDARPVTQIKQVD